MWLECSEYRYLINNYQRYQCFINNDCTEWTLLLLLLRCVKKIIVSLFSLTNLVLSCSLYWDIIHIPCPFKRHSWVMFSVFTYLYSHHHHLIQSTPVTPESALIPTSSLSSLSLPSSPGVSRLLVSLGHTGRRVVLGHTLNTQIVKKKKHLIMF